MTGSTQTVETDNPLGLRFTTVVHDTSNFYVAPPTVDDPATFVARSSAPHRITAECVFDADGATGNRTLRAEIEKSDGSFKFVQDRQDADGSTRLLLSALVNLETRGQYVAQVQAEYERVAEAHARAERNKARLPLERARANRFPITWADYAPVKPSFLGARVFRTYDVAELVNKLKTEAGVL